MQSIKIVRKGGAEYTKKKQKTTCFWLEQKADAERILIPHQLEKCTLGHPPFSSVLHMSAKDGKML